ncbi:MAG: hypothetical protein IPP41_04600 [Rhodocyclaceae bacterium]|nr:hypothetical protein [Rhodocyclaceae bacterium]
MANPDRYKTLLYSVLFKARQMGEYAPGTDMALACYQILEVATSEAEAYGIDLAELSLAGFDPADLLKVPPKKVAS